MTRRRTTQEFIIEAQHVHDNKYGYDEVNYINSHTKVTINCPEHGIFEQRPNDHLRGRIGCSKCIKKRRELLGLQNRSSLEVFIKRATELHGDRYDYSHVNYITASTTVSIGCQRHGEFCMTPNAHLRPRGCPKCGNLERARNERINAARRSINHSRSFHNEKYNYDNVDVTVGVSVPVSIVCPRHGEFYQTLNTHKRYGCNKCASEDRFAGQFSLRSIRERFPNAFGTFYCLRCTIGDERFLKFGITTKSVEERYIKTPVFDYEVSVELGTTLLYARELEIYIRNNYSQFRYFPSINFPGYTECYNPTIVTNLSNDSHFSSIIFR